MSSSSGVPGMESVKGAPSIDFPNFRRKVGFSMSFTGQKHEALCEFPANDMHSV